MAILLAGVLALPPASSQADETQVESGRAADSQPFGIQRRASWTTSRITGSPDPPAPYAIERVFGGLKFKEPTVLTNLPGSERLFVVEREGRVFSFPNRPDVASPDLVIDLKQAIPGMKQAYGMTFHPRFAENRYCYITYVLDPELPEGTRVSRFTMSAADPPRIEPASEQIIITWLSGGHNGGCLKFGPDGLLYISTGDAGPAFPPDPRKSGQDVGNLLSSVLRIDVDHAENGRPYAVPGDNPFVQLDGARGEVWAYGMRNPWKMSFDPATGDLWVGDVGWELWEMIYNVKPGDNYGWSLVEGRQPVHRERTRGPTPIKAPAVEHSHTESRSITGGFVYRGDRLPELVGAYVYGDYVTGKLWAARHDGKKITEVTEIVDSPIQIICFGVDNDNELYVVDYAGEIYRLKKNDAARANREFPTRLSETGLFQSVKEHAVAPGVIAYSVSAEPWADHAIAERFVAVPGLGKLGVHTDNNVQKGIIRGAWKFPADSVLVKTISLQMKQGEPSSRQRLETQILHYDVDTWRAYSYHWNDEQTDAVLSTGDAIDRTLKIEDPQAPGGARTQAYHFASRSECLLCHTTRGGSLYGFVPEQLKKPHDYGAVVDDQLRTLTHIGLFEQPVKLKDDDLIPDPLDETAPLARRARAYLHVNCGHCHRRGGGGTAAIEVPYSVKLNRTHLLDARPTQGSFGIHSAQVLAPGDPYRSVLYYRMAKLGRGRMPYFGSHVVDPRGVKLIHDWIADLTAEADKSPAAVRELRERQRELLTSLESADSDGPIEDSMQALLKSTSGALLLLRAVDDGRFPPQLQTRITDIAGAHPEPQIRDLFERFLPEDKRVKRLGAVVDAAAILNLPGSSTQGGRLFASAAGVQCKNCHKIGDVGRVLGPDLAQIGKKYNRAQLLETILQPSKAIDPKYLTYLVETKDGRVHAGLLASRDENRVLLTDSQGKEIRIAADNIELIAPQQKSLMPELLLQDMTAQQVADLLAYLSELK